MRVKGNKLEWTSGIVAKWVFAALLTPAWANPHAHANRPTLAPPARAEPAPIRVTIDPTRMIGSIAISQPLPAYPHAELCKGIGGAVDLVLEVDERGHTVEVTIERSSRSHAIDIAAIEAARGWTLVPHMHDGIAIANRVREQIRFDPSQRPNDCPPGKDSQDIAFAAYHLKPGEIPDSARIAMLKQAADAGNVAAQVTLGGIYVSGNGVTRDTSAGLLLLERAAAQGDAFAEWALGQVYSAGTGVPRDSARSRAWFEKAAAHDLAFAELSLAQMYRNGEGVPVDNSQALVWLRKSAMQGNAEAQGDLGFMIGRGEGVPPDIVLGVAWLTLAGEQIAMPSSIDLRKMKSRMTHAQVDEVERMAATWGKGDLLVHEVGLDALPFNQRVAAMQQQAATGDAAAELALGDLYARVYPTPWNAATAVAWYEKAAGHGSALAAHVLADAYDHGFELIGADRTKIVEWYRTSIRLGNADDALPLGTMYQNGIDVPRDLAEAARLFGIAAAHGNVQAQIAFATALARGAGVTRDDVLAYAWFELASRQAQWSLANGALTTLKARMGLDQIVEAERLAASWQTDQMLVHLTSKRQLE